MKPIGKTPSVRRALLALVLAFAVMASHAMAQSPNADVTEGLALLNKTLAANKQVSISTATVAQLQTIINNIVATTATASVSGTFVQFPAPTDAPADVSNILQILAAAGSPKSTTIAAAPALVTQAYTSLGTESATVSSTSALFGQVAEAAATDSLFPSGKNDAAELAVLEAALAHTATYNNAVADVLLVSDSSSATAQATLVEKAYLKVLPSAGNGGFVGLGTAIETTDGSTLGNGASFLANVFALDKLATDQEGIVEGYTAFESATASALEATGSNIVAVNALNSPASLPLATRENIALGLIESGTAAGDNANTTVADVTQGVASGFVSGAPAFATPAVADKDIGTYASALITALGLGDATTISGAAALELNAPTTDVGAYAALVSKNANVKADPTGIAVANVAGGTANDYVLTGTGDGLGVTGSDGIELGLKVDVTEGVVGAYKTLAPQIVQAVVAQILATNGLTTPELTNILAAYIGGVNGIDVPTTGWNPNDALRANMLLGLVQDLYAGSSTDIATIPAVVAAGGATEIADKTKNVSAVVQPILAYFYGISSGTTGATAAAAVTEQEAIAAKVSETGTDSGSVGDPAQVAAALIVGAKTTGTEVEYIAEGTATDTTITSNSTYGNQDGYVAHLGNDLISASADIASVATGLATLTPMTPEAIATDLTNGTGTKQALVIADTLVALFPSHAASIAGSITGAASAPLTPAAAMTDSVRLKVASAVLATVQSTTSNALTYAAAVSGSIAATEAGSSAAGTLTDKETLAKTITAAYSGTAGAIGVAIAQTYNSTDPTIVTDDLGIAAIVVKTITTLAPSQIQVSATSIEEVVLSDSGGAVTTGTTFANGFTGVPAIVPAIAYTAAAYTVNSGSDQSVQASGQIAVGIDELSKVVTNLTLSGSVALSAAQGATPFTVPTVPNQGSSQAVVSNNYTYYTIAGLFGAQSSVAKLALDFAGAGPSPTAGGIAASLSSGLQQAGTAVSGSAQNQAAAAIAYDLVNSLATATYVKANANEITAIVSAVVSADPAAAADIFGYAAEAVDEVATGWGPAKDGVTPLQTFLNALEAAAASAANTADPSQETAIDAALLNDWNPNHNGTGNDLSIFELSSTDMTYVTADETPITPL